MGFGINVKMDRAKKERSANEQILLDGEWLGKSKENVNCFRIDKFTDDSDICGVPKMKVKVKGSRARAFSIAIIQFCEWIFFMICIGVIVHFLGTPSYQEKFFGVKLHG